jgi:hypothetical protein
MIGGRHVAVNLIVLIVTLLMAAFTGVWLFNSRLRAWMEQPKHRFVERQRRFPGVIRSEQCPETGDEANS